MDDLTLIYYTDNSIPDDFSEAVRGIYVDCKYSIVSVSHKPIKFGQNICIGNFGRSLKNIYLQILIGLQLANTEYVALCEHDVLYPPSYFECRPTGISYNHNKYDMNVWLGHFTPTSNTGLAMSQCIGKRELLIKLISERIATRGAWTRPYHSFEPGRRDIKIGLEPVAYEDCQSQESVIDIIGHGYNICANGKLSINKSPNILSEVPYWGKFNDVAKKYKVPGWEKWKP